MFNPCLNWWRREFLTRETSLAVFRVVWRECSATGSAPASAQSTDSCRREDAPQLLQVTAQSINNCLKKEDAPVAQEWTCDLSVN